MEKNQQELADFEKRRIPCLVKGSVLRSKKLELNMLLYNRLISDCALCIGFFDFINIFIFKGAQLL